MRLALLAAGGLLASALASSAAGAGELRVVVTIKPLHALVMHVMAGAGSAELLVKGAASPHAYALKPSEARAVNNADLFFRMSESVEPFTAKLVASLPRRVEVVTLQHAPGMTLLPPRTAAIFERHVHASHERGKRPMDEAVDGHAWLDPHNAKAMVDRIARALGSKAPAHAATFTANADALKARLDALAGELDRDLKPIADRPYIVFHDAFQYLERRYGLNVVGSISINPETPPSGKRLTELRRKIQSLGAMCVFAEPRVDMRLLDNLIEGTSARTGMLDPEGGGLDPGPDLYFVLMRKLAAALKDCLAAPA
jgi:zinc transport system substrate-binding protein